MTGYLLLICGEASLARRGLFAIMRAIKTCDQLLPATDNVLDVGSDVQTGRVEEKVLA